MSLKEQRLRALDAQAEFVAQSRPQPPPPTSSSTTPSPSASRSSHNARKSTMSISHMSQTKAKPTLRIVFDIVTYLKKEEKPLSKDEISISTGHEITPEVDEQLRQNPRIKVISDSVSDILYCFKPIHEVKNREELCQLVLAQPNGIPLSDLRDSYKEVEKDAKKLAEERKVVILRNQETKDDVIYPVDPGYNVSIFPDFITLWKGIKIPDAIDLEREMREAGISLTDQVEVKKPKRPSSKEKKTKQRRLDMNKITNVHMKDKLDLTKDYVPEPKKS